MIVAKLLAVHVQPTYVLVDTDTHEVVPAPNVQPFQLTAADVGALADVLESGRQQIESARPS